MPRPCKCRKVCCMPKYREFYPANNGKCRAEAIVLTVDEYESVRLIDREGFSQEKCGEYMKIARTTVQLVYNSARRKIAEALVSGLPLKIDGGNYRLCDGKEQACLCGGCEKHRKKRKEL